MTAYQPDEPSPPGATLHEVLQERKLHLDTFAYQLGISIVDLYQLLSGEIRLTPELALRLERLLGITARFWNKREQDYRAWVTGAERVG